MQSSYSLKIKDESQTEATATSSTHTKEDLLNQIKIVSEFRDLIKSLHNKLQYNITGIDYIDETLIDYFTGEGSDHELLLSFVNSYVERLDSLNKRAQEANFEIKSISETQNDLKSIIEILSNKKHSYRWRDRFASATLSIENFCKQAKELLGELTKQYLSVSNANLYDKMQSEIISWGENRHVEGDMTIITTTHTRRDGKKVVDRQSIPLTDRQKRVRAEIDAASANILLTDSQKRMRAEIDAANANILLVGTNILKQALKFCIKNIEYVSLKDIQPITADVFESEDFDWAFNPTAKIKRITIEGIKAAFNEVYPNRDDNKYAKLNEILDDKNQDRLEFMTHLIAVLAKAMTEGGFLLGKEYVVTSLLEFKPATPEELKSYRWVPKHDNKSQVSVQLEGSDANVNVETSSKQPDTSNKVVKSDKQKAEKLTSQACNSEISIEEDEDDEWQRIRAESLASYKASSTSFLIYLF